MQYAVSRQGVTFPTIEVVPRSRLSSHLSRLTDGQHATVRPITDDEILCVWQISHRGCVRLIGQFAEEDEMTAMDVALGNEDVGYHCVILPKSLGRPSFHHRKAK